MRAEHYRKEKKEVQGKTVNVTSYKIGERYFCHIDNVNPGVTIARTQGASREEAQQLALQKVSERFEIY